MPWHICKPYNNASCKENVKKTTSLVISTGVARGDPRVLVDNKRVDGLSKHAARRAWWWHFEEKNSLERKCARKQAYSS
jgi:hypothetical protein